ncbi:MAG: right-handed parallel beta-helix repeat-containing protein [Kiritimatiellae bacterium]|nr:right-handed parallel beta-helix repeat-containing protein [Kiritimatiellia bacterium]
MANRTRFGAARKSGRVLRLGMLALLSCGPLRAATYYVAVDGKDAWNGLHARHEGGRDGPWRTIGHMARRLAAGDTVHIRGGDYSGAANVFRSAVHGTAAAPITIRSHPGETARIHNIEKTLPGMPYAWTVSHDHYVIEGLVFECNFRSMLLNKACHTTVRGNAFRYLAASGNDWAQLRMWNDSQYNRIVDNTFEDLGRVWYDAKRKTFEDSGIALQVGHGDERPVLGIGDDDTCYNLIESNRFHRGGHDLIDVRTARNVIRGNTFHNENWMPYPKPGSPDRLAGNRITKPGDQWGARRDRRNVWEHNALHYTGNPPDDDGGFGIELSIRENIFRFNTIAFTFAAGLFINNDSATNYLYHNTVYGTGLQDERPAVGMFLGGISMSNYKPEIKAGNRILNNLIWNCRGADIDPRVKTWQVVGENYTQDGGDPDPLFVHPGAFGDDCDGTRGLHDFRLRPGSPAIDRGAWLTTVVSADGTGRSFAVRDAGFFSDGNRIVQGDTIQLDGQTATAVITAIDLSANRIEVDRALSWTTGQGVALAYAGRAPDMGAFEGPVQATAGHARGTAVQDVRPRGR